MADFPICGKRAVWEALFSKKPYAYKTLCVAHGSYEEPEIRSIVEEARKKTILVEKVDSHALNRHAPGFLSHQGVVLILARSPELFSLDALLRRASKEETFLTVALDSLEDHQNIGSIARSAMLFGARAIIAPKDRSAPLIHPSLWRVAQGAAEHLELIETVNLVRALSQMKEAGFWVMGTSVGAHAKDIREVSEWPKKTVVVLGSEQKGMRRLVEESCDVALRIPTRSQGNIDSLNVNQAATIILWEISKRGCVGEK